MSDDRDAITFPKAETIPSFAMVFMDCARGIGLDSPPPVVYVAPTTMLLRTPGPWTRCATGTRSRMKSKPRFALIALTEVTRSSV
jgi:hypothetical protein